MKGYVKYTSFYSFSPQRLRGLQTALEDLLNLKSIPRPTRLHLLDVLASVRVAYRDVRLQRKVLR